MRSAAPPNTAIAASTVRTDDAGASPIPARADTYNGGKGRLYQQIINQIPPHQTYIEAFLGNGSVLRMKRAAERTIGIERNPVVILTHWRGDEVRDLTVVCDDATRWLRAYPWAGGEFVYCDPPYLMETRSSQRRLYDYEMGEPEQHRELLAVLRSLPCPVAISGYWSELYAIELAGWRTVSFQTVKRSGRPATEWLWMNYPEPLELHDYGFLGDTYRSRERIKRKRERWKDRLRRLPALERLALFSAIAEVRAEQPVGNIAGFGGTAGDTDSYGDDCRHASSESKILASTVKIGDVS